MIADYIAFLPLDISTKPSHTYGFSMSHSPSENNVYNTSYEKLLNMRSLLDKDLDVQTAETWAHSFSEELVRHCPIKHDYH